MQIHLSKPGGLREGPFTIEQINKDLTSKKYEDGDYWAWYEGLTEWIPLHSVPGIASRTTPAAQPPPVPMPRPAPAVQPKPAAPAPAQETAPAPQAQAAPPSLNQQLSSGMPFDALEHIFLLTTGDAPTASRSPVTTGVLEGATGEKLDNIREKIRRDVIGKCDFLEKLRGGGSLPDNVWRALANLNPELIQRARGGSHKVCVRTFQAENQDLVTLLLFYRKTAA
jgi:hypothetical protein